MAGNNLRKQQAQTRTAFTGASYQGNLTKPDSVTFSSNGTTVTPQISAGSRAEVSLIDRPERMNPIDLELSRIDACNEPSGTEQQRRVQRDDLV